LKGHKNCLRYIEKLKRTSYESVDDAR
jgi:hypothetical protein